MFGRLRGALLAAAVALFGLAAPAAKADFIYDLTVSGSWSGSGNIAFNALSGSSPAGVTAFAFHVNTGAGSPQDYALSNIATVSWSIDASMNLSLLLTTPFVPFGTDLTSILLTNQPDLNFVSCGGFSIGTTGSLACHNAANGPSTLAGGTLTASLVPIAIPEPTTLTLFGAGLVGLGLIGRRRKAA